MRNEFGQVGCQLHFQIRQYPAKSPTENGDDLETGRERLQEVNLNAWFD
jgi:hypothetical protein